MEKNYFLFVLMFFSTQERTMQASIYKRTTQVSGGVTITPTTLPAIMASYIEPANFDGLLDATFGSNGFVTTNIPPLTQWKINTAALQTDNRIVVGGEIFNPGLAHACTALARYNVNGSLDTTFGTNGTISTSLFNSNTTTAVLLQLDNKIVSIGHANNGTDNFALIRYNSDGTLDSTFNGTGIATTLIGTSATAYTGLLQPDGKIIAAGIAIDGAPLFALTRYNPDGTPDTTFNTTGHVTTAIPGFNISELNAVLLQPDGKIIAIGYVFNPGEGVDYFALIRYESDGTVDTTFGDNGIVTTHIPTFGNCITKAAVLQSDGKIIALGYAENVHSYFALVRYNSNGTVDTTFGTDGAVTTDILAGAQANAGLIQSDNKIIAVGFASNGIHAYFTLTRYTTHGALDSTFGTNGIVTSIPAGMNTCQATAALLQPNNNIIAAGWSNNGDDFFYSCTIYKPTVSYIIYRKLRWRWNAVIYRIALTPLPHKRSTTQR